MRRLRAFHAITGFKAVPGSSGKSIVEGLRRWDILPHQPPPDCQRIAASAVPGISILEE
jgi:hypothetical protein